MKTSSKTRPGIDHCWALLIAGLQLGLGPLTVTLWALLPASPQPDSLGSSSQHINSCSGRILRCQRPFRRWSRSRGLRGTFCTRNCFPSFRLSEFSLACAKMRWTVSLCRWRLWRAALPDPGGTHIFPVWRSLPKARRLSLPLGFPGLGSEPLWTDESRLLNPEECSVKAV